MLQFTGGTGSAEDTEDTFSTRNPIFASTGAFTSEVRPPASLWEQTLSEPLPGWLHATASAQGCNLGLLPFSGPQSKPALHSVADGQDC